MAPEQARQPLIRFIRRVRPLGALPIAVRYAITVVIVLFCFAFRYGLDGIYPYPYLPFVIGILVTSFLLDRGSGFLATGLSALLAIFFFIDPPGSFRLASVGALISVAMFVFVGMLAASIIEALRNAVEMLAKSEASLAESLNLIETVIASTPDAIAVKDREGRYVRANAGFAKVVGRPASELIGKRDRELMDEDQAARIERGERIVLETRSPFVLEEELPVAGQGTRTFHSSKAPWYGPDGKLWGLVAVSRDIEERKRAEEALRRADAQKELLLYDINHRVKNHLQSVVSTLSISRRRIADPAARAAIDTTIARLGVLARVYDRLQLRPGGEAVVGARDFVEGLCSELAPALVDLRPIALRVSAANEEIELGRAVSVGLVINEALANALKHAFPDDRAGTVHVNLGRDGDDFRLEVADDGVGHPPDAEPGIGTRLMRALAQQLGGTLEIEGPPGTRVALRFPANGG